MQHIGISFTFQLNYESPQYQRNECLTQVCRHAERRLVNANRVPTTAKLANLEIRDPAFFLA